MKDRIGEWPQADTCQMGVPGADGLSVRLVQLWAPGEQALVHSSLEVGGVCMEQLGGCWLLKRGSGWTRWRGPRPVHTPPGPSATCPCKDCLPKPPSRPSISGFSFIFGQVPALLGACSAVNETHTHCGDMDETKTVKWAVGHLCHPALESPCHGRLLHAVSAAWSPWLWHALCVCGVVSVSMTQSLCLRCNLCVRGVASVSAAWPPRLQHCLCGRGVVSMAMAWSPCQQRGPRGRSLVSVSTTCSLWHALHVRGVFSVSVVWWCVRGMVSVSVVWSPCQQHGLHGCGVVSMATAWSLWPCLAFAASPLVYLPLTC